MKRLLGLFLVMTALFAAASADKARYVSTKEDSAYHNQHLCSHIGGDELCASGNYVKVRVSPSSGAKVAGHVEQADRVILLQMQNSWAEIEVTSADSTSRDSWNGLTGWVDADYLQCGCSSEAYYGEASEEEGDYETAYACTANNLRVRTAPETGTVIGHIEKADRFRLLETSGNWVRIQVTFTAKTSPDSWVGLTGWVSGDYIDYTGYRQLGRTKISTRWKSAYLKYIAGIDGARDAQYALICVNDDDIPELWIDTGSIAAGNHFVTYLNGSVDDADNSVGMIRYIKNGNKLYSATGHGGQYSDEIYTIKNGVWRMTVSGNYTDRGDYCWNGLDMTETEYRKKLAAAFAVNQSLEPECMNYKAIQKVLGN